MKKIHYVAVGLLSFVVLAIVFYLMAPALTVWYIERQGVEVVHYHSQWSWKRLILKDVELKRKDNLCYFDLKLPHLEVAFSIMRGIKEVIAYEPKLVYQSCSSAVKDSSESTDSIDYIKYFYIKHILIRNMHISHADASSPIIVNVEVNHRNSMANLEFGHEEWLLKATVPFKIDNVSGGTQFSITDGKFEFIDKKNNYLVKAPSIYSVVHHKISKHKSIIDATLTWNNTRYEKEQRYVDLDGKITIKHENHANTHHLEWDAQISKLNTERIIFEGLIAKGLVDMVDGKGTFNGELTLKPWKAQTWQTQPSQSYRLSTEGKFTQEGFEYDLQAFEIFTSQGSARLNEDKSKWSGNFVLKSVYFGDHPFVLFLPKPYEQFKLDKGLISIDGSWGYHRTNDEWSFDILSILDKIDLKFYAWTLQELSGKLLFDSSKKLSTSVPLTIQKIMGPLELEKINLQASFEKFTNLYIKKINANIAGGQISVSDGAVDTKKEEGQINLKVERVDMAKLVSLLKLEELTTQGIISGVIPIKYHKGQWNIQDGKLNADDKGKIQYIPKDESVMAAQINQYSPLPLKVLKDYHFETLSLNIQHHGKESHVVCHLVGYNPDFEKGRSVILNLDLKVQLGDLFKSLTFTEALESSLINKISDKPQ